MEETKIVKLYDGKVEIKFVTDHFDKHDYYDIKGKRLYGVTYYSGIIDKSAALLYWAVDMMGQFLLQERDRGNNIITEPIIETAKREYRNVKKEAADIGKEIHAWIGDKITGKDPEIPDNKKVVNGITAFLRFQKEHNVQWLESERLVFSKKYKYPGTADAIGKMGKDLVLFDFKSSKPSKTSPDGIYPEHAIQTAGYQLAYEEETGKKISHRVIIALDKETGDFRFREFKDNVKDKKAFINCVNLRRRLTDLSKS